MGSYGAGRLLLLLGAAFIALFHSGGQAEAGCSGDYCYGSRPQVYYTYSYSDRYYDRSSYRSYDRYSDCGSACYRERWNWDWLFGSSDCGSPCYRYRSYRPRYYHNYAANYYDMYNPKNLPPLRAGDNGMLPGVNPRQEWFNKHGTTGYAYYGWYGATGYYPAGYYGSGYYGSRYGYPVRRAHYRSGSTCGRYGYWNGDYCADARWEKPFHRSRYW